MPARRGPGRAEGGSRRGRRRRSGSPARCAAPALVVAVVAVVTILVDVVDVVHSEGVVCTLLVPLVPLLLLVEVPDAIRVVATPRHFGGEAPELRLEGRVLLHLRGDDGAGEGLDDGNDPGVARLHRADARPIDEDPQADDDGRGETKEAPRRRRKDRRDPEGLVDVGENDVVRGLEEGVVVVLDEAPGGLRAGGGKGKTRMSGGEGVR
jgi:hypothetical protein